MKQILTTAAASAMTVLFAIPLISISSTAAIAYDYCRRDVAGHMTGCSFDNMEQCEAMRSGIGGDCFRDPFLKDDRNIYAYQPMYPRLENAESCRHALSIV